MKISEKDKYLLTGLLGVLLLVVTWFLVVSPLKEKTEEVKTQNSELKTTAELYQQIAARQDEYQGKIKTLTEEREDLLDQYPVAISREDEIMFWANMENTFYDELAASSLTMSTWEEVLLGENAGNQETEQVDLSTPEIADLEADPDAGIDTTETDAAPSQETETQPVQNSMVHLYRAPINFSYVATYNGVKDMLNFLYTQGSKKNVENLSIAFDSSTGNLAGTIDINLFFMTGTDKEYQPVSIPSVQKGVSDVFHTVEGNRPGESLPDENTDENETAAGEEDN